YQYECCFTAPDADQDAANLIIDRHRFIAVRRFAVRWPKATSTRCPCFSVRSRPADQWNKGHRHQVPYLEVARSFAALGDQHEHLSLERIAHWNHHPSA